MVCKPGLCLSELDNRDVGSYQFPVMFVFQSRDFPIGPGIYMMKDCSGHIIYVGKAKSLRRRLASYFRAVDRHTPKTRVMVGKIASVDVLCTGTEKEALLLEESLIKKHKPRYNIVLRDDKRYLLFKLNKRSEFPRLTVTRKVVRDGSHYFGPFVSADAARVTYRLINRVFPLRKCTDRAMRNRVRPCLYHHINQCPAPCVMQVSRQEYHKVVERVEMLLSGRSVGLLETLRYDMEQASHNMEFEKAAMLRDQIRAVQSTVERQAVVQEGGVDKDVVDAVALEGRLSLGVLFIRQGRLLGGRSFSWLGVGEDDIAEVVESFLPQFYGPERDIPQEILLPWPMEESALQQVLSDRRGEPVRLSGPMSGLEKKLLRMARENAMEAARTQDDLPIADMLGRALRLSRPAERVECVDISHLSGGNVRAGVVVFTSGRPTSDANRVYALEEAEGTGDDYLALHLWAQRRIASGPPWPDLLLVDGGKGQLAAVLEGIRKAGAADFFEVASIAKAGRKAGELDDVVFRPGRKNPMPLKRGSPELLFLQRVRDAAHDYVIGRQRRAHRGKAMSSRLESLEGVGPKTASLLWKHFDSLESMAAASEAELLAVPGIGKKGAARLYKQLAGFRGASVGNEN